MNAQLIDFLIIGGLSKSLLNSLTFKKSSNTSSYRQSSNSPITSELTSDLKEAASEVPSFLNQLVAADQASNMPPSTGPFVLPPLEYAYDALEPYIDEKTMRIHHDRLHQAYVTKLNAALSRYPELYHATLEELLLFATELPSDIQTAVINNGGGHYNHSLFWKLLTPEKQELTSGPLLNAINRDYGSFDNFQKAFTASAMSVFGSGYTYLVSTPSGRLEIITTSNQDTPIPLRRIPILLLDVWEHGYYLQYLNERNAYIDNWWNLINWPRVNARYEAVLNTPS